MKENYSSWGIDINAFPRREDIREQLKFLLGFAILAPSGHNSQPWEFSVDDNTVAVRVNKERSLEQSDPERRQLLISIGCAIENLLVAADYYGFSTRVAHFPNSSDQDLVTQVMCERKGSSKNDNSHLIFAIPKRRTNRNKYEDRLPSETFLNQIKSFATPDFRIDIIKDQRSY